MIKAIESANSLDRKSITDSLAKVTVTGITGKIAFDPYPDQTSLYAVPGAAGARKSLRTVGGSGA